MQEISNEVLRLGAGGYLIWYLCCVIFVGVTENRIRGFRVHQLVSLPFYGFFVSFAVPVLFIAGVGFVSFIYRLTKFVFTGEF